MLATFSSFLFDLTLLEGFHARAAGGGGRSAGEKNRKEKRGGIVPKFELSA